MQVVEGTIQPPPGRALSAHVARRAAAFPAARRERLARAALWLAMAVYVAVLLPLTFRLVDRLATQSFDLAIFDQAAWLISRGHAPFVTVRGLPLLGEHFSAVLYLLAPLYWVWPSPRALLAAQTVALALGALPAYGLARRRTGSPLLALACGLAYLLYPALQWSNAFEFHPDTLATPCLLGAFYCLDARRWRPYFGLLALAALTKETVGPVVLALGLYVLAREWRTPDRKVGWQTLGLGALALAASLGTVALLNHGRPSMFFALYGQYGRGPGAIARYLLAHPGRLAADLNTGANRRCATDLLSPVLFLPLLAPEVLLVAAPALLLNLLSASPLMHTIHYQYTALVTPCVFAATARGMGRALRWGNRTTPVLLALCLALGGLNGAARRPLSDPGGPLPALPPPAVAAETRAALALIPPGAPVAAPAALLPGLDHRARAYLFPNPFVPVIWGFRARALAQMGGVELPPPPSEAAVAAAPVEYVVFSPPTSAFPVPAAAFAGYAAPVVQSRAFGIVAVGPNALVLRRGADHARGLRLLARAAGRRTQTPEQIEHAFRAWVAGPAAASKPQAPRP